jgi:hypothetical protein
MRRSFCATILLCTSLVCWPALSRAQFEVVEVGVALWNSGVTAVQSVTTAAQAVKLVADSVKNLAGLDGTSLDGLGEITGEFTGLMEETRGLLWDLKVIETQIKALFDLQTAPNNATDLQLRLDEIRVLTQEYLTAARRVQTVVHATVDAVQRILRIVDKIADLAGNRASQAQIQEQLTLLVKAENEHSASVAAYQQASLVEKQSKPLIQQSLRNINREIRMDWAGPVPR